MRASVRPTNVESEAVQDGCVSVGLSKCGPSLYFACWKEGGREGGGEDDRVAAVGYRA